MEKKLPLHAVTLDLVPERQSGADILRHSGVADLLFSVCHHTGEGEVFKTVRIGERKENNRVLCAYIQHVRKMCVCPCVCVRERSHMHTHPTIQLG